MRRHPLAVGLVLALGLNALPASAAVLDFQLLSWGDAAATVELPSAAGRKPVAPAPTTGDWLVFTDDDQTLPAANNPAGALSHNLADLSGMAGAAGFNMAPSLTGSLTLQLDPDGGDAWQVAVTNLTYQGTANASISMNQYLVTAGDPATQSPGYNVDGVGNDGTWSGSDADHWAIQYDLDFYFDASISPSAIDVTFNDKTQAGYLIPASELTAQGLAGIPSLGFAGDLGQYLLDQVVPRLPAGTTYLLVTQMTKVHPDYAAMGMPINTGGLVGNLTVAYSMQAIPEPATVAILSSGLLVLSRRRRANRNRIVKGDRCTA
ncbi:MAG: PEP-CTERM sorting domain-containing protein [Phycisphaeraceae bacterium]|nr:PEP-CTERM sorting domain-containing protein [Phycisphaeraceae bacterium]